MPNRKRQEDIRSALLPAFRSGQVLEARDLIRIQHAINIAQSRLCIETTIFEPFREGQFLTAEFLNQLLLPIDSLRRHLGLPIRWKKFPVEPGVVLTANTLNELQAAVNEVLRALIEKENVADV